MRNDFESELSDQQAVTTSAGTEDQYDRGAGKGDLGVSGKQLYLMITVDEAAAAAGAATVEFQAQVDDDSAFGSPKTVAKSQTFGKAELTVGRAPIYIPLPPGTDERYVRGYFSVGTGPLTAGKFSCHITGEIQHAPAYPDAL